MCLAVALDLRRLIERLPTHAVLSVVAINALAGERLDDRKHAAIAQVAIVGEGGPLAAGLLGGVGQPLPQVAGIVATQWLYGGVGLDQAGLGAVLAEDDAAVPGVAGGV